MAAFAQDIGRWPGAAGLACLCALSAAEARRSPALKDARTGMLACAARIETPGAAVAALKTEGWRFQGNIGTDSQMDSMGLQWLELARHRALFGVSTGRARTRICYVVIAHLQTRQATARAEALARDLRLEPTGVQPGGRVWLGTLRGRRIGLNVVAYRRLTYDQSGAGVALAMDP